MSEGAACPKCGRARLPTSSACPRCGLIFARWPVAAAPAATLTPETEAAWADLLGHWGDAAGHDAFVKRCALAGQLAAAGRLYRGHLDRTPGDPLAARMQARIVAMASAALVPSAPARPPLARTRWFWWVVVTGAVAGILFGVLFGLLRR